jgi:hypothetical protein
VRQWQEDDEDDMEQELPPNENLNSEQLRRLLSNVTSFYFDLDE